MSRQNVDIFLRTSADLSGVRMLERALRQVIGLGATQAADRSKGPPPMPTLGQRAAQAAGAAIFGYGPLPQRAAQVAYIGAGGDAGGNRALGVAAGAFGVTSAGAAAGRAAQRVYQEAGQRTEAAGLKFISTALGGSVEGFLFQSAETFMQLDNISSKLQRRFRDAKDEVSGFGRALTFTRREAYQIMDVLGGETDSLAASQFNRYAGFARDRGLDPAQAMRVLGQVQRLAGRELTDGFLGNVAGRASARGMGQGRLGEYLQLLAAQAENAMQATGSVNLGKVASINDLPGLIFGATDPRGQGQMGASMLGGLQGMMGNSQVQTFLMRSMGYGEAGGPGYIEARKRLEAGIYDERNLASMFREMQARGMSRGGMFRAIESVAGGQLKAWQIEAMVDKFGTADGLAELEAATAQGSGRQYLDSLTGSMSGADQARFASGGFAATGQGKAGMGAARDVEIEGMQLAVGEPIAEFMASSREVMRDLAGAYTKLLGSNPLELVSKAGSALENASESLKNMIPEGGWREIGGMIAEGFTKSEAWSNLKYGAQLFMNPIDTAVGTMTDAYDAAQARRGVAGSGP